MIACNPVKPRLCCWWAVLACLFVMKSAAADFYVVPVNANSAAPYQSWNTAATNIQDAVDLAGAEDTIWVTNGVYGSGSRVAADGSTNRVLVGVAITLQSVNGAAVTAIDGGKLMRCLFLTNNAILSGFTLTNGNAVNGGGLFCSSTNALVLNSVLVNNLARSGGGAYSGTLSNCTMQGNTCPFTGAEGGGVYGAVLTNCTLSGNSTGGDYPNATGGTRGGGASSCSLSNCTLSGNSALGAGGSGGGASSSTLIQCTVQNNYADFDGGGAYGSFLNGCQISSNGSGDYAGGVGSCTLTNCTLSNNGHGGGARPYGGGATDSTLNNCLVTDNVGTDGAGAFSCTLNNCVLSGNTAYRYGGGMAYGTANNCTIYSNALSSAAYYGGGAYSATLNNSIVYFNPGTTNLNGAGPNIYNCTLNYCCSPGAAGPGCITNPPAFVDAPHGDAHLQSTSPCINAGKNTYATTASDLDGNPRIKGGTVDMGVYEFQNPGSSISYAWLQQYGLPHDGSADLLDPDGDGMNNRQEWSAGTDPTNALSVLKLLSPVNGPGGVTVSWQSVNGRTYYLLRCTNLQAGGFSVLRSNLTGQAPTTSFLDTNPTSPGPCFYRVAVQE